MKKVIISILVAGLLIVGVVTPVFAEQGGDPNDNAYWGEQVSTSAHENGGNGLHASNGHEGKKDNPPAWGEGGIRGHCGGGGF